MWQRLRRIVLSCLSIEDMAEALMKDRWTLVSMKDDWTTIFPPEK
jgi:hypothetical protein